MQPKFPRTVVEFSLAARESLTVSAAPSVSVAYGVEGLAALEADWRALFQAAGTDNYFVSYDWCKSWLDAFGTRAGARPVAVNVWRSGRLVALLPLVMRRYGPLSSVEAIGADSGQYCDMLIAADAGPWEEIFALLWDGIAATGIDLIQFANVRDDSALAKFLSAHRTIQSDPIESWVLDTRVFANFEAYVKARSSSLRKNIRRRRRRLEALGPLRYEVETDPAVMEAIAAIMIGHKLDWLENRHWHGRFLSRKGIAGWLAEVARRSLATGHLHLSLLKVGDKVIAAQLGFICGGRFTAYLSSFDMAYSHYGVGRMQYAAFIEDVFGRGLKIDLMPRHEEFKMEWAERGVAVRGYAVAVTRRGAVMSLVQNPRMRAVLRSVANFVYSRVLPRQRKSNVAAPTALPSDHDETDA